MTVLNNRAAVAGSAAVHFALILWLFESPGTARAPRPEAPERTRTITHLIDPPTKLTQRAPNRQPLSKELVAEAILPRPYIRREAPAPQARQAAPPAPRPQPRPLAPTPATPEPPKIEIAATEIAKLPQAAPPPAVEKPKLAFETPQPQAAPVAKSAINPNLVASNPIQDAVHNIARTGVSGSQAVGDAAADLIAIGPGLNLPPSAGRPALRLS